MIKFATNYNNPPLFHLNQTCLSPLCLIKNETPPSSLSLFVLSSPHTHTHTSCLHLQHTNFVSFAPFASKSLSLRQICSVLLLFFLTQFFRRGFIVFPAIHGSSRHLLDIQTYIQALGKSFPQFTPLSFQFWARLEWRPKRGVLFVVQ